MKVKPPKVVFLTEGTQMWRVSKELGEKMEKKRDKGRVKVGREL
jgi:hypothetical protein